MMRSNVPLALLALAASGCVFLNDYGKFMEGGDSDAGPAMDAAPRDGGGGDDSGLEDAGPDLPDGCAPTEETCNGEDDDCDGTTDEEPTECGADGATTACVAGACEIVGCEVGLDDCDAMPDCETDVTARRDQCGGCTTMCTGTTELCNGACVEAEPAWGFVLETNSSQLTDLEVDDMGNVVAAGEFAGIGTVGGMMIDSGAGDNAVVVSLDPDTGAPRWVRHYGGVSDVTVDDMAMGNGIIWVGGSHEDAFDFAGQTAGLDTRAAHIVSYAADGSERGLDSFTVNGPTFPFVRIRAMTTDAAGNVYVHLTFRGTLNRNGTFFRRSDTECQGVLFSMDPASNMRFSRPTGWCGGDSMVLGPAESQLHLAGDMESGATLGGRTFPNEIRGLRAVFSASNGAFVRAFANGDGVGQTQCPSEEQFNAIAITPTPGGAPPLLAVGLYCDGSGNYGGGVVDGDAILVGYNATNDTPLFSRQLLERSFYPNGMDFGDGLLLLGGGTREPADLGLGALTVVGGTDAYLAAIRPGGETEWGVTFGGTGFDVVEDVDMRTDGAAFAAGQISGAVTFGEVTLSATGTSRGFVLRMSN